MTSSTPSLLERQARLIARSQALREELASSWNAAEPRITSVDRSLSVAGRWMRNPAVIGMAVMIALTLGRKRALKLARAGLGLVPTALHLRSIRARR